MGNSSITVLGVILVLGFTPGSALGQSDSDLVSCSAAATWLNCPDRIVMGGEAGVPTILHLLGQVSAAPQNNMCLPADLHVAVAYMDSGGRVLCVGILEELATIDRHVQDVSIEVNPVVLHNFGRWLNEPGRQAAPAFSPLGCMAPDGRRQLLDSHLGQATSLSVTATLLPKTAGLATSECRIQLAR